MVVLPYDLEVRPVNVMASFLCVAGQGRGCRLVFVVLSSAGLISGGRRRCGLLQDSRRSSECGNIGSSGSRNGGIECGCWCSVFTKDVSSHDESFFQCRIDHNRCIGQSTLYSIACVWRWDPCCGRTFESVVVV